MIVQPRGAVNFAPRWVVRGVSAERRSEYDWARGVAVGDGAAADEAEGGRARGDSSHAAARRAVATRLLRASRSIDNARITLESARSEALLGCARHRILRGFWVPPAIAVMGQSGLSREIVPRARH